MSKTFTIALVVDNVQTYLQNPGLASLADRIVNVYTAAPVPNPDYATMHLPMKVVEPVKIPDTKPGDVVFLEWLGENKFEVVATISNFPSSERIQNAWLALLSGPLLPGEGLQFFDTTGNNLPLGLGLIHLPFNFPDFLPNFPALVWLAIALFSGYKAYNTKKTMPRIALAAVAWLAAAKFVKTQKQNIKL